MQMPKAKPAVFLLLLSCSCLDASGRSCLLIGHDTCLPILSPLSVARFITDRHLHRCLE